MSTYISVSKRLTTPSGSEADGTSILVATPATGAFAGQDEKIAFKRQGSWTFQTPLVNSRCNVSDETIEFIYSLGQAKWASNAPIHYARTTDVSLPSLTKIEWETETWDNNTIVTHSTSTDPEELTINFTGLYRINYSFEVEHGSGNAAAVEASFEVKPSGGSYAFPNDANAFGGMVDSASFRGQISHSFLFQLTNADTIRIRARVATGGSSAGEAKLKECHLFMELIGLFRNP